MKTLKLTKQYDTYPEYKDSGVGWLGEIPKGWETQNLQWLFFKTKRTGFENEELLSVYRDYGVVPKKSRSDNHNKASEDLSNYQLVEKGDLAINKMKAWQGSLAVSQYRGIVSPAYYVAKSTSGNNGRFLHYLLRIPVYFEQYKINSGGVRNNQWDLDYDQFKKLPALLPSTQTQQSIVTYLDEKTARIDSLIKKKKKLITLLREKRTAVINQAVTETKGELVKIKNVAIINPSKSEIGLFGAEDKVSFVPMEALSEAGDLSPQSRRYELVKNGFTYFRNNDVVLAKITPCYENGKAGVMQGLKNGFGFGTTEFLVLRPAEKILSQYLYYVIFSDKFRKEGEIEMRGTAGQKRVTTNFVREYEFCLPDLKEQEKLVLDLERKTGLIDHGIKKVEKSIELLQEFKSSLISHVVTGKVKV